METIGPLSNLTVYTQPKQVFSQDFTPRESAAFFPSYSDVLQLNIHCQIVSQAHFPHVNNINVFIDFRARATILLIFHANTVKSDSFTIEINIDLSMTSW